jgi:hypothetical protein
VGTESKKGGAASGSPRGANGGDVSVESKEERWAPASEAGKAGSRGHGGGNDVPRGGWDSVGKGERRWGAWRLL